MFKRVVIIGCGLIGCSIAGAVKEKKLAREIVGVEINNIEDVQNLNFFNSVKQSILEVDSADLVILSISISNLENVFSDLVCQHHLKKFRLITDVLSTKNSLLETISKLEDHKKTGFKNAFLSSHPLAGSEKIGAIAADVSMFENTKVLICPFSNSERGIDLQSQENDSEQQRKFDELALFWGSIGGIPKTFPIEQHDLFFAGISHFPHLVSFCLALVLSRSDFSSKALSTHGGGLRDSTRIAGASPDLWSDIIFDNKDQVLKLIHEWSATWNELSSKLKSSDKQGFRKLLLEASTWRNDFKK